MSQDRDDIEYLFFSNRKKIYVCLNHRVAYLCWLDAFRKGIIKSNALLFHIDFHADFWLNDQQLIKEQEKIAITDEQKLKAFVKDRLDKLNTDFIVLSMYRGIIGDAISVSRKNDTHLYGQLKNGDYQTTDRHEFKDNGNLHTFYLGGSSVLDLVGHYGLLTDGWRHKDVQKVFKDAVRSQNVILDIDLDYFTYQSPEGRDDWAFNKRHLETIFQSAAFLNLLNHIDMISIALEPSCCGGNNECRSILGKLNSVALNKYGIDIEKEAIQKFKLQ